MRFVTWIVVFLVISVSAESANADVRFMQGLGDTHYQRVNSSHVGRHYHVFVRLPDGYERSSRTRYPTIYLLDGGGLLPMLGTYYKYLTLGKEVPEAILVGISYGADGYANGNFRSTDFTVPSATRSRWGGASKFQKFLSDELMPLIEKNYRSRGDRRVIFGHSLGGHFVLYTALTKPGLFWGHIASNPALHGELDFFLERHGESMYSERSRLFVASAAMDEPRYRQPALEWIAHWSRADDRPWELKTVTLGNHSHMSAAPASFRQGLHWLFSRR